MNSPRVHAEIYIISTSLKKVHMIFSESVKNRQYLQLIAYESGHDGVLIRPEKC
jgi:hypothetical protein